MRHQKGTREKAQLGAMVTARLLHVTPREYEEGRRDYEARDGGLIKVKRKEMTHEEEHQIKSTRNPGQKGLCADSCLL